MWFKFKSHDKIYCAILWIDKKIKIGKKVDNSHNQAIGQSEALQKKKSKIDPILRLETIFLKQMLKLELIFNLKEPVQLFD